MSRKRKISLISLSIILILTLCFVFQILSVNAIDINNEQPYRIVEERETENGFSAKLEFDIPV